MHLLLSLSLLNLIAAMAPGPDFAVVSQNTIAFSRRHGLITAFGIATAVIIHASYCLLGLGILIAATPTLFTLIKVIGGGYLLYLGFSALVMHTQNTRVTCEKTKPPTLTLKKAYVQGFVTNLSNPKCMLFFIALFSAALPPHPLTVKDLALILAFFFTTFSWFSFLVYSLSHPLWHHKLQSIQPYLVKLTGLSLIFFGVVLFFVHSA